MENTSSTKFIKKGVPIKFNINSNIIQKLYEVATFMSKSLTKEQVEKYQKEVPFLFDIVKGEKTFSEEWMIHMTSLTILIQQLEGAAEEQGLTYEADNKEVLDKLEATLKSFIEEDNQ